MRKFMINLLKNLSNIMNPKNMGDGMKKEFGEGL